MINSNVYLIFTVGCFLNNPDLYNLKALTEFRVLRLIKVNFLKLLIN